MIHFQECSGPVPFCHTLLVCSEVDNGSLPDFPQFGVVKKIVHGPIIDGTLYSPLKYFVFTFINQFIFLLLKKSSDVFFLLTFI